MQVQAPSVIRVNRVLILISFVFTPCIYCAFIISSPLVAVRIIAISLSVCLSVCQLARLKNTC